MQSRIVDALLQKNEELRGSDAILGKTCLTKLNNNNGMRSNMFTSHLDQFVNLTNPDIPRIRMGTENVVGDHSGGYKEVKNETTYFRKVEKFGDILDKPTIYMAFMYDKVEKRFFAIERNLVENLVEIYGYEYDNTILDEFIEGDTISKGTVLTRSKSYDENMNYRYGKQVRVLFTNDPYTSEDAAVCSESFAKSMESIESDIVHISMNDNDYPINVYGDVDNYKIFPDIGEKTNGILCALRRMVTNQMLCDFKASNLMKVNKLSDTVMYVDGIVTDITIYCNNEDVPNNDFYRQINKYLDSQRAYYKQIKKTCKEIMNLCTPESGMTYDSKINHLYKRASDFLNKDSKWSDGTSVFGNMLIDITVMRRKPIRIGQKITGRSGNKSVISKIRPDHLMPHTIDGERIDLLVNNHAIVNRTTGLPLFEIDISNKSYHIVKKMKTLKTTAEKAKLLFSFIEIYNKQEADDHRRIFAGLSKKEKERYIEDVYDKGIFIKVHPFWDEKPLLEATMEAELKFGDLFKPDRVFINHNGQIVEMMNEQYVGEMYMLKMKQTSEKQFSARSSGPINSSGLPDKSYKTKRHQDLVAKTPVRFGEFETFNFNIGMTPDKLALFHCIYRSSTKARRDFAKSLLTNNNLAGLEDSYDINTAKIFDVMLKSIGLRCDRFETGSQVKELDDTEVREYQYNGVTYVTTEWDFAQFLKIMEYKEKLIAEHLFDDEDEMLNQLSVIIAKQGYSTTLPLDM